MKTSCFVKLDPIVTFCSNSFVAFASNAWCLPTEPVQWFVFKDVKGISLFDVTNIRTLAAEHRPHSALAANGNNNRPVQRKVVFAASSADLSVVLPLARPC